MTIMQPDNTRPYGYRLVDVPDVSASEADTLRALAAQSDADAAAVLGKVLQILGVGVVKHGPEA